MQSVLVQNNCHAVNNDNNKTNEQNQNRLIQVIYRQFAESTRFITDFMILVNVFCFLIRYQYLKTEETIITHLNWSSGGVTYVAKSHRELQRHNLTSLFFISARYCNTSGYLLCTSVYREMNARHVYIASF